MVSMSIPQQAGVAVPAESFSAEQSAPEVHFLSLYPSPAAATAPMRKIAFIYFLGFKKLFTF